MKLENAEEEFIDLPYGGLFGNTHQIRVIKQILADPFGDYRPKELEALVEASAPSVRRVLKSLTNLGLLIKNRKDKQHPVYAVNIDSKRYLILTLLAYAVLDDENGTNYTDDLIADYYNSELRDKYESDELMEVMQSVSSPAQDDHWHTYVPKGEPYNADNNLSQEVYKDSMESVSLNLYLPTPAIA